MKLLQYHERRITCADGGLEGLAIFLNIFALIPVGKAKIKDAFIGIENAGAAAARAEAVDKPREFFEWSEFQNLHAPHCSQQPRHSYFGTRREAWRRFAGEATYPRRFGDARHRLSIIAKRCWHRDRRFARKRDSSLRRLRLPAAGRFGMTRPALPGGKKLHDNWNGNRRRGSRAC